MSSATLPPTQPATAASGTSSGTSAPSSSPPRPYPIAVTPASIGVIRPIGNGTAPPLPLPARSPPIPPSRALSPTPPPHVVYPSSSASSSSSSPALTPPAVGHRSFLIPPPSRSPRSPSPSPDTASSSSSASSHRTGTVVPHLAPPSLATPSSPFLSVRVSSHRKRFRLGKTFTEFEMRVETASLRWETWKRYSEFAAFHRDLHASLSSDPKMKAVVKKVPKLPPSKLVGNLEVAFVDRRLADLDTYLTSILAIDELNTCIPVLTFLGALERGSGGGGGGGGTSDKSSSGGLTHLHLDAVLSFLDSGDVVLFRTSGVLQGLQRTFTGSKYDHVGIVIRIPWGSLKPSSLHILESTSDGVATYDLHRRLRAWHLSSAVVAVRQLKQVRRSIQFLTALDEFVSDVDGLPYGLTLGKLLRREIGQSKDNFFCSELVATAYMRVGLIDASTCSASAFYPSSFNQENSDAELKLQAGAELGPELVVDFIQPAVREARPTPPQKPTQEDTPIPAFMQEDESETPEQRAHRHRYNQGVLARRKAAEALARIRAGALQATHSHSGSGGSAQVSPLPSPRASGGSTASFGSGSSPQNAHSLARTTRAPPAHHRSSSPSFDGTPSPNLTPSPSPSPAAADDAESDTTSSAVPSPARQASTDDAEPDSADSAVLPARTRSGGVVAVVVEEDTSPRPPSTPTLGRALTPSPMPTRARSTALTGSQTAPVTSSACPSRSDRGGPVASLASSSSLQEDDEDEEDAPSSAAVSRPERMTQRIAPSPTASPVTSSASTSPADACGSADSSASSVSMRGGGGGHQDVGGLPSATEAQRRWIRIMQQREDSPINTNAHQNHA